MVMLLGIVTVMATGGADGGGVDGEEEDYDERGSDELHWCCLLLLLPMWISTKLMMHRLNVMMISIGEDHSVDVIVMTWVAAAGAVACISRLMKSVVMPAPDTYLCEDSQAETDRRLDFQGLVFRVTLNPKPFRV